MAEQNLVDGAERVLARSLDNLNAHTGILGTRPGMSSKVVLGRYIVHEHVPKGADSLSAAVHALYESARQIGPLIKHENALVTFGVMDE